VVVVSRVVLGSLIAAVIAAVVLPLGRGAPGSAIRLTALVVGGATLCFGLAYVVWRSGRGWTWLRRAIAAALAIVGMALALIGLYQWTIYNVRIFD
jgi:hypothetical protein